MEPAKSPIVNVWSVRKEQLAARATSSGAPAQSSSAPISPSPSVKLQPARLAERSKAPALVPSLVPPVSDKESWPEVTASLGKDANGKEKESERSKEQQPKKADKTKKWVPIPAEELQAAADALKSSSSNRRSKGQSGDNSRDRSSTRKNLGANQQAGVRGSPSQAASTSHSRVPSRSTSVQSSPRGIGRRRLPEERRDRDSNSNTASPRINGARSDDSKLKPPHPSSSSTRSSKSGSPHLSGDFPPPGFQPPPHLHHPLPPPPHLYPHAHFQPYGGMYPPPPPQGVPYGISPMHGNTLLPPSPGGERPGDGYRPAPQYPVPQHFVDPRNAPVSSIGHVNGLVNGSTSSSQNAKLGSVKFGSIDLSTLDSNASISETTGSGDEAGRTILIGVQPDEVSAVVRGIKNFGIGATNTTTTKAAGKRSRRSSLAVPSVPEDHGAPAEAKGKWEFGTTTASPPPEHDADLLGARLDIVVEDGAASSRLSPLSMSLSASPNSQLPLGLSTVPTQVSAEVSTGPPGLSLHPQHPPGLALPQGDRLSGTVSPTVSTGSPTGTSDIGASGTAASNAGQRSSNVQRGAQQGPDADFEVRDYGYGFGRVSGSGRAVELVREEMVAREREREWERARNLAYMQGLAQGPPIQPHLQPQGPGVAGRDGGGDRRSNRAPRPYEGGDRDRENRGGSGGIRRGGGRGGNVGGGHGGPPSRHVRRSNTPQTGPPGPHGPLPGQPPHFNPHHAPPLHMPFMPPPPGMHHQMHVPPPGSIPHDGLPSPNAYFGGMRGGYIGGGAPASGMVSFLPPPPPAPPLPPQLLPLPLSNALSTVSPTASAGTGPVGGTSQPPVPAPMTTIMFPLDPTRYYLLGQLEYYLSQENMAQDFFLRQQMDSRGWIPISLIASFNRVRRLTPDVNLVREVLYLSSMVQVREQWVRMGGWERYVLPGAVESVVPEDKGDEGVDRMNTGLVNGGPLDGGIGQVGVHGGGGADVPPMYLVHNGVPVGDGGGVVFKGSDDGTGSGSGYGSGRLEKSPDGGAINGAVHGGVSGEVEEDEDEDDVVFVMGRDTS